MTKRNQDIRDAIKQAGVYNYEVAEQLGCSENWFSVQLHKRLTPERKQAIRDAIQIAKENKNNDA